MSEQPVGRGDHRAALRVGECHPVVVECVSDVIGPALYFPTAPVAGQQVKEHHQMTTQPTTSQSSGAAEVRPDHDDDHDHGH
jgi:hypothetical protein